MRVTPILSLEQPGLDEYSRLTDVALRRVLEPEGGLYIAESPKVIERALRAGHVPRSLLLLEQWLPTVEPLLVDHPDVPVFVGSSEQLEGLTGFRMHRGALASMHRPELVDARELLAGAKTVVVLENLVDHTNVGAVFRAAAGMGADAVLVTQECADPLYRRSVRVSMGTVFQVPWTRLPTWHESARLFSEAGFDLAALALDDRAVSLRDYARERPERVAILLGAEGDGLSRAALSAATTTVMIPMLHGVDSLNVAAASAVALYALTDDQVNQTRVG